VSCIATRHADRYPCRWSLPGSVAARDFISDFSFVAQPGCVGHPDPTRNQRSRLRGTSTYGQCVGQSPPVPVLAADRGHRRRDVALHILGRTASAAHYVTINSTPVDFCPTGKPSRRLLESGNGATRETTRRVRLRLSETSTSVSHLTTGQADHHQLGVRSQPCCAPRESRCQQPAAPAQLSRPTEPSP
jgi:hypothetical protein